MDQSIIRVYVGEIIKDKDGSEWLISNMELGGFYKFINLTQYLSPERLTWREFKYLYYPVERVGKVNGVELLDGEDWFCHDERCYPRILADGCSGCEYSKLVKERKRYFEPGDEVWIPSEKKIRRVVETSLFRSDSINGPYFKINDRYDIQGLSQTYSVRYRVEKYPSEKKYYKWNQIRMVKRNRHFINPEQLKHVCNDLCLFGPYGGVRCGDCETGKIWKETNT
jgi:hypothetical protein